MSANEPTPALRRLLTKPDVVALSGGEAVAAFVAHGTVALLFTGNAARYPEIDDLAVVLPEIMGEFPGRFHVGVIDPDADRPVAARYKVTIRPTLVFVRDGVILGALPRMRDWAVYLDEVSRLLAGAAEGVS
jgi:hydrogenase-1 operon protein HyaE